jgi:hypothetical protein
MIARLGLVTCDAALRLNPPCPRGAWIVAIAQQHAAQTLRRLDRPPVLAKPPSSAGRRVLRACEDNFQGFRAGAPHVGLRRLRAICRGHLPAERAMLALYLPGNLPSVVWLDRCGLISSKHTYAPKSGVSYCASNLKAITSDKW